MKGQGAAEGRTRDEWVPTLVPATINQPPAIQLCHGMSSTVCRDE